jgi:hypothetical protein
MICSYGIMGAGDITSAAYLKGLTLLPVIMAVLTETVNKVWNSI